VLDDQDPITSAGAPLAGSPYVETSEADLTTHAEKGFDGSGPLTR
jgi:hypothetical protein